MTIATQAPASLLEDVAAAAADIDAAVTTPRGHLSELGAAGLLDLDVRGSAQLISELAGECMSTGFSVWAHRMVIEYLRRGLPTEPNLSLLTDVAAGRRVGSTAMASGLKWLAGIGDVTVTATPIGGGWALSGFIPWASNLFDDGVVVLPATTPDGTIVVWVPAADLSVKPVTGLLALNATASGNIRLDDVIAPDEQLISDDLRSFASGFRPTFLVLQTAFCVGLIRRALAEAEASLDRAENSAFAPTVAELIELADEHRARWEVLVADLDRPVAEYLRLRLDAALLAAEATRLESTLAGGRGYQATSGSSRRFREAAFLPVQSPSEGQLRWELSSLA
ncbi:MAG TPA: acyl-CoA/acyl-ACP dehydrogenase [Tessaracoccus flavescens]|uniref:Acyl-CoA/acyl-ACP dehydrogenase n=1 Tax=Tessaracoccus flavescens TaxID=399497 RepID=A0A921ERQ1_9ACTN|nr:acyl-CoA/acyl-ACP dehydrogenase [Tessaracoccus flavescens]